MPGKGGQKQYGEIIHAVLAGHRSATFAGARLGDVQTNDKGTHDQYVVPLDAPHGGAKVPALQKVVFLAKLQEPLRRRGFKSDIFGLDRSTLRARMRKLGIRQP